MAEILIKVISAVHSDPTKDQRGCYKRGDPVAMFESGHVWGTLEVIPPRDGGKFIRIRITDVTVAQVNAFVIAKCGPGASLITAERIGDPNNPVHIRKRRVRFDIDLLPASVRNALNNTGFYETTWSALRSFVKDKIDTLSF